MNKFSKAMKANLLIFIFFLTDCSTSTSDDKIPYENRDLNFRMKFPAGWTIKPGYGRSGTISADLADKAAINIQVKEIKSDKESIYDIYSSSDFIESYVESLKKSFLSVDFKSLDKIKVSTADAYYSEQNIKSMLNGQEATFLMCTVGFYNKGKIYIMTYSIIESLVSKSIVQETLTTFQFFE